MRWGLRLNEKAKVNSVTNIHLSVSWQSGMPYERLSLALVSVSSLSWRDGMYLQVRNKALLSKLFLPVYFSQQWEKQYINHAQCGAESYWAYVAAMVPVTLWWDQAWPCRWKNSPLLATFYSFWNLFSIASSLILLVAFQADVPNRSILLSCVPFTPWSRKSIMVETTLHL